MTASCSSAAPGAGPLFRRRVNIQIEFTDQPPEPPRSHDQLQRDSRLAIHDYRWYGPPPRS
jgi:hypothetical protein